MNNSLTVQASPLPFSNHSVRVVMPQGVNLEEIAVHVTGLPIHYIAAHMMIDGHIVPRENWHRVFPKEGALVNFRMIPQGGGGKKSPLASLLSIAIMLAAPGISGAILGKTLAGTSALGGLTTYGSILSGGIGMVGRMLVSAIVPPPKQSNRGSASVSNQTESQTYFIQGASNQLDIDGVIPINLGKNRVFPKQAALPYSETKNDDQYVRQLFLWGYGKLILREEQIGETAISEFEDIKIVHRLNKNLSSGTSLFTNSVAEVEQNVVITQAGGWVLRTTQLDTDEGSIDITFERGLCEFNDQGARLTREVQLEVEFAPTGTSSWLGGVSSYKSFALQNLTASTVASITGTRITGAANGFRRDIVVLNKQTGVASIIEGQIGVTEAQALAPVPPSNTYRLATALLSVSGTHGILVSQSTSVVSLTDDRQPSWVGVYFELAGSFAVTNPSGRTLRVAAGGLKYKGLFVSASQTNAKRVTVDLDFPSRGQWDVRVRRLTADSSDDQVFDEAKWTALRSITLTAPVSEAGVSGTAMRIRGSDQLSGAVDQYNGILSTICLDYDPDEDVWVEAETSNPASLLRYVLQHEYANSRPLTNAQIDLAALEEWHVYCESKGYTYNRYIDYEASIDEILQDIASAGRARYTKIGGLHTVVVDKATTAITQIVTPHNSWGYKCEVIYPDIPHAFKVKFRNAAKGYILDERIVYDDGYNSSNATKYEVIEYLSCTNADLAYIHGREMIATGRLRRMRHTFEMDVEHLVMNQGDRILLAHDIPLYGSGSGRIKTIISGATITGFVMDDVAEIVSGTYYARIRKNNFEMLYLQVTATPGSEVTTFTFVTPQSLGAFEVGDLCYIVRAGGEVDLRIHSIEPRDDFTASIVALDYAPAIFNAATSIIPDYTSNITVPVSFQRVIAPVFVSIQSDESVIIRNSDGTATSRAVITLRNLNSGEVTLIVKVRVSGVGDFALANYTQISPNVIAVTGLDDGIRYDFNIYYKRTNSALVSKATTIRNYKFIGASGIPANVTGFLSSIIGDAITLQWAPNADIDLSHYNLRYSSAYSGATWETSVPLRSEVKQTSIVLPFLGGTYFIKAVDYLGNVSAAASSIVTYDPSGIKNVIATVTCAPDFSGTFENCFKTTDGVMLEGSGASEIGYFYPSTQVNLGGIYTSYVTASFAVESASNYDIYSAADLYSATDIYDGTGDLDIYSLSDIYSQSNLYGGAAGGGEVELQYDSASAEPWIDPANIATFPQDFDNAAWTKTGCTVIPNYAIAPDGTMTADFIKETTATSARLVNRTITVPSGTTFTQEIYVKPHDLYKREGVTLYGRLGGNGYIVDFNLQTNTATGTNNGTATGTNSITDVGGGWKKLSITIIFASAITSYQFNVYFSSTPSNGNASYTGDGRSGVYLWQANLVSGANGYYGWNGWQPLQAGQIEFYAIRFRAKLLSTAANESPKLTALTYSVDMPDRIERGEDVTVPIGGLTVTFSPAFKEIPAIPAPSIQNGVAGDRIEWVSKTASGFSLKVYNDVAAAYVSRTIDWVASGYGRVV